MRIIERIASIAALIILILRLLLVLDDGTYVVYSMFVLVSLYFYFGFALFNGIGFKKVFKKTTYAGVPVSNLIVAGLSGVAMSIACMGIVFKLQQWPGAGIELYFGTVLCIVAVIVSVIKKRAQHARLYNSILTRALVLLFFCFLLIGIHDKTLFEFMYRDHPTLIQAREQVWADPSNPQLRENLQAEWKKFHQH